MTHVPPTRQAPQDVRRALAIVRERLLVGLECRDKTEGWRYGLVLSCAIRQYPPAVPFDPKRLRIERFNVEWHYHATYTFYDRKGAIAERWAHGPLLGAVGEVGGGQINLTPASDEEDHERLVAVAGMRASAVLGEGKRRAGQALEIWSPWLHDVESALKPLRSVRVTTDMIGLYPIKDEWKTTQRIKLRYYQSEALEKLAGAATFHAAPDILDTDGRTHRTIIMGVLGPPHRGQYFTFENRARDTRWWLATRLVYTVLDENGLEDPLDLLGEAIRAVSADWKRVSENVLAELVD